MNYIIDTNIILAYLRKVDIAKAIEVKYNLMQARNTTIISIVSVGEVKSLAIQNNWGNRKQALLDTFLNKFIIADINFTAIVDKYAEIDAFSQGKLQSHQLKTSARNMGKNDLWIAATASVLNATLLTMDKDFLHLDKYFINLELITNDVLLI